MFFAGLFAMYFTIRSVRPDLWATQPAKLHVWYSAGNTIILVLSSAWCQMGVFAAERFQPRRRGKWYKIWERTGPWWPVWRNRDLTNWGMQEWFVLTYLSGSLFVAGQVYEYAQLTSEHVTISSDAYGSVFYLTTGFHALHVTAGLIAFLLIIGRSFAVRRFGRAEATSAIVTSYYWHFVDVVWIGLFAVIYLLQ